MKDFDINHKNFGFTFEEGEYHMSLGNMTDVGWYWSNKGVESIPGFLWRLAHSQVKETFIQYMREEGIEYSELKQEIFPHIELDLYIYSGDNAEWKFGGNEIDYESVEENFKESNKLTDEQMNDLIEKVNYDFDTTFEAFENTQYANNIIDSVDKAFKNADTFEELFEAFTEDDMSTEIIIEVQEFKEQQYYQALRQGLEKK